MPNPFFHRGPVRDPTYFFGRTRETAYLADLLRGGQSAAISGPRRIGKTSLLHFLMHPTMAAAHGLDPRTTHWVYLDGGALDGLDDEWLYGAVDRALGGEADAVPYPRFLECLRRLVVRGERLILALDEFELIAANPRFGPALFNRLRGLAAQFPIQFVTASKDPLFDLTFVHPDTLSSPFFNIFAPVQLGLFSEAEAINLLAMLSERAGCPFANDAIAELIALVGPHPLFLQAAGYRMFAALSEQPGEPDRATMQAQILADLEPHLRYAWSSLDSEAQYVLATLPLLDSDHPALLRLHSAGLLCGRAYPGSALEAFVRRQPVEGLLQGGPLLIDLRGGRAIANGAPLHLTPTELAALRLFLEHPGELLTPEMIEAALWPTETITDPERARGVVKKLRAALGPAGEAIVNRRGQGYVLQHT